MLSRSVPVQTRNDDLLRASKGDMRRQAIGDVMSMNECGWSTPE